jgi:hypothetical protein
MPAPELLLTLLPVIPHSIGFLWELQFRVANRFGVLSWLRQTAIIFGVLTLGGRNVHHPLMCKWQFAMLAAI